MENPLNLLPGYALRRASAAMMANLGARLAHLNVRTTDAAVLVLIAANPGITQSELCRTMDIQSANMTPLIAKFEKHGWLEREAVDGRSHGLSLTASGIETSVAARAAMEEHEIYLVSLIPAEHRVHFMPALTTLWEN